MDIARLPLCRCTCNTREFSASRRAARCNDMTATSAPRLLPTYTPAKQRLGCALARAVKRIALPTRWHAAAAACTARCCCALFALPAGARRYLAVRAACANAHSTAWRRARCSALCPAHGCAGVVANRVLRARCLFCLAAQTPSLRVTLSPCTAFLTRPLRAFTRATRRAIRRAMTRITRRRCAACDTSR